MKLEVKEVMTTSVVSIRGDATIDEAIALLLRHNVSGLPVVDDQLRIVGVLSERDLLDVLYDLEIDDGRVIDYATRDVVTLRRSDSLLEAVDHFVARPIRRLPVVDHHDKLVGVVSRRDLIRFIRDMRLRISGVLEKRRGVEASAD